MMTAALGRRCRVAEERFFNIEMTTVVRRSRRVIHAPGLYTCQTFYLHTQSL